jgi:hypothetical protein
MEVHRRTFFFLLTRLCTIAAMNTATELGARIRRHGPTGSPFGVISTHFVHENEYEQKSAIRQGSPSRASIASRGTPLASAEAGLSRRSRRSAETTLARCGRSSAETDLARRSRSSAEVVLAHRGRSSAEVVLARRGRSSAEVVLPAEAQSAKVGSFLPILYTRMNMNRNPGNPLKTNDWCTL